VTTATLDETLHRLDRHKTRWAQLPIRDKVQYLLEVRDLAVRHADAWVAAGAAMKGLPEESPLVGAEEWLGGPYPTISWLTDVMDTLRAIEAGTDPLAGCDVRTNDRGQAVVRVLPHAWYDRLLLNGMTLDVWLEPGVAEERARETIGGFYQQQDPPGRVTLVLGAGNVSAIPILDALYALVADGDVVVLKMNPVNECYAPVFEQILEPLIRDGYVSVVTGDADVGETLVTHELVSAIHLTGSERTYNAIIYGPGRAGQRRQAQGKPRHAKPVRAELGGAGPTIVAPGRWTAADIRYQAEHIATQKLHSSGHTCVASQVLVLPSEWDQREEFLDALRTALASSPERRPFYPGADERREQFLAEHPGAEALSGDRALLADVDPEAEHPAFREEFFGPIVVTVALPGHDPGEFLRNAVKFANDRLHGNLGANIIVHPDTAEQHRAALDDAVAELRYGCVGVNAWSAFVFLASRGAWGAFPGNTAADIQSGTGVVHNALLFDRPQKNVVTAPFRPFPRSIRHGHTSIAVKPPWFLSNATATSTARQLTMFAADPAPHRLPGLFAAALRG
jgi:aldehyde dehydrogenase (NAD(P)+)